MRRALPLLCCILPCLCAPLSAQSPALHVKVGHVVTLAGDPIDGATVVIRDGRIEAIATEIVVPEEAEVLDLPAAWAYPGLVDPFSQIGIADTGAGANGAPNRRMADSVYPFQEAYLHAARAGYTTLCLVSRAWGIAGEGAVVRSRADSIEGMLLGAAGPLVANYRVDAPTPDSIKATLDKGGDDGGLASVKRALAGEVPLLIACRTPGEVVRALALLEPYKQAKPVYVLQSGDCYLAVEALGQRKADVIVPASIVYKRLTRVRVNLPKMLLDAGCRVACVPASDSPQGLVSMRFAMADLVKAGLDRDAALRAVTSEPARMLGLDYRLGTLQAGRDGNLTIVSGDLLDPRSEVLRVIIEGQTVYDSAWGGVR